MKSTTRSALGRWVANARLALSGGHGAFGLLIVVAQDFPRRTPASPMARISRSTVHLAP